LPNDEFTKKKAIKSPTLNQQSHQPARRSTTITTIEKERLGLPARDTSARWRAKA
jgi:hypothetical protein